jgi:import receptor subunit TOM20
VSLGYYDTFPPKSMNVAVKIVDKLDAGSTTPKKGKILVVTKDVAAGEVIYTVRMLAVCRKGTSLTAL